MLYTTLTDINEGILPHGRDALTNTVCELVMLGERQGQMLAVAFAATQKEMTPIEWGNWVVTIKISAGYRYKLLKVGKMLLGFTNGECCTQHYRRLFTRPFDVLVPLARIPEDQLINFLAVHRVESMDREAVRRAVNAWLGEEPAGKLQPELPGLGQLLDFINDNPDQAEQALAEVADSRERAQRTIAAGMGLAGGGFSYFKRNPAEADIELLQTARAALIEEAAELENLIKAINS